MHVIATSASRLAPLNAWCRSATSLQRSTEAPMGSMAQSEELSAPKRKRLTFEQQQKVLALGLLLCAKWYAAMKLIKLVIAKQCPSM